MQNREMIRKERERMGPLIDKLEAKQDPKDTENIESTVVKIAANLKRGLSCSRGVTRICVDCTEVGAVDPTICDYRDEQIAAETKAADRRRIIDSVHVPGTTPFTVDI